MKAQLYLLLTLSMAIPGLAVKDVTSATEGTVRKIDAATKTVVVATKDGAEHTFHFGERTAVHSGDAVADASKETLHGLKEGTEVVVHYSTKGTVDTAEEIDRIGERGLHVVEGSIRKMDHGAKTITIATADGTEHTFRLLDRAALGTGKDLARGADKSAKITVYYAEEGTVKVAHFLKRAL